MADAFRSLLKMSRDVVRVVLGPICFVLCFCCCLFWIFSSRLLFFVLHLSVCLGYLLGTEGRNAVRFAQETERILKTGPER